MKTMCKTRGGRTSERDKISKKRWTSDAKKRKKGTKYDTTHKLRRSVFGQTNNNNLT